MSISLDSRHPSSTNAPGQPESHALPEQFCHLSNRLQDEGIGCLFRSGQELYLAGIKTLEVPEIIFKSRRDLHRFIERPRLLALGTQFVNGEVDYRGSFSSVIDIAERLQDRPQSPVEKHVDAIWGGCRFLLSKLGITPSPTKHYCVSPLFYRHFLDRRMQYTCGLFEDDADTIDQAQENKLRFIAEKLSLSQDVRHLDVGCGWGGLIEYMMAKYGTDSYGLTNTPEQRCEAAKTVANGEHRIEECDYSKYRPAVQFDAVTIVGMLEHVPIACQQEFFRWINGLLSGTGKVYLQTITKGAEWKGGDGTRFLRRFVFPGYEIDSVHQIIDRASSAGLSIRECHDHSTHYAKTIRCWINNLIANEDKAIVEAGGDEYRKCLAYLSFAERLFVDGRGGGLHRLIMTPS